MPGLLAFFSALSELLRFLADWWRERGIRKNAEYESVATGFRRALQLLRESDGARADRARLDAKPSGVRKDDGYLRDK